MTKLLKRGPIKNLRKKNSQFTCENVMNLVSTTHIFTRIINFTFIFQVC